MKTIFKNIIRPLAGIALFFAVMTAAGCSMVNDPDGPCPPEEGDGNLALKFRITAMMQGVGHDATRADDNNHEEVGSDPVSIEEAVNVKDIAFFIFAGKENDAPLLARYPSDDPSSSVSIVGSPGYYNVNVNLPESVMLDYLGKEELDPNGKTQIDFRILILANATAGDANTEGDFSSITATTFGGVTSQVSEMRYKLDGNFYNTDGNTPASRVKGLIPMYGLKSFRTTEAMIYGSRPEDRIDFGEISLLRAVSKVRIEDRIENRSADGYPKITGATFGYLKTSGYVCPKDAGTYVNGTQVHTANIPEQDNAGATVNFIPIPERETPEWFVYVPEQKIAEANPVFNITVQRSADATDVETYVVPMSGYNGNRFEWDGTELLRNHIYTLSVTKVELGINLELTVSVTDWNESSLDLSYDANVSLAEDGALRWNSGFQTTDNPERILTLPWTDTPTPAECGFTLATPEDMEWHAYLIPVEGAQGGAFGFLNDKGETVPTVSGVVNPQKQSILKIVTTDNTPAQTNAVMLQIVVTLADGSTMEANVVGKKDFNNYIIVQQKVGN